ncbi:2-(1,2-epoxy-1,2-dihydrophenyl)acetyl-CoA isomerase [Arenicella chitinivorans]|uniref:2-(1,2-epoxy-1,2-dihydrophenyl)acetyl-CoA isomerase n=1 Tax=Arenicella chitinivorans TaxID=1329800 RepID=A0A918S3D0_9GAMM|nr:enoyl-CoA hydratase-related protein [Arenicella chitinivorans]GHA21687.1 2-(1,2-epoxy-1,2-dihydrophenyl)acetyl-CoA isomerase [Arenicella chitinivorans]
MSEFKFINYSVTNRVATIALNTPDSLNAFHQAMRLEFIDAVKLVEQDDDVRVAILTGEGRSFSAGANLKEGTKGHDSFVSQCAAEYTPWLMGIHDSSKLYIAAVNGVAAGIGSAAVMNCDLVMMADDAYLYQAFSAIGLMPDGGATWLLLQKLGYQRALEMAVDAGRLTADECLQLGVANKVVPAAELREKAQAWAEHLAAGAPLAQTAVKRVMRRSFEMSYAEVIDAEAVEQTALGQSEDAANAIQAFFAKTKTVFKGR